MITKENSADGSGAGYIGTASLEQSRNGHCTTCGQILIEIPFRRQRLVAHVCDNLLCCRDRSPQFYTEIPVEPAPVKKRKRPEFRTEARLRDMKKKKENYALLRSLKVPSIEARNMTSDVRTDEYLKRVGYARC